MQQFMNIIDLFPESRNADHFPRMANASYNEPSKRFHVDVLSEKNTIMLGV